jgi:hypothetical protein
VGELVVGGAAHHGRLQRRHELVGDRPPERAGGVDVAVPRRQVVDVGRLDLPEPADALERRGAHVGRQHRGAVGEQVLDEVGADLADALDRDPPALERRRAPGVLGRGAHGLEDAVRREDRAVAGPALLGRAPGGEAGLLGDDVHVPDVGADVAGGVVATAERLDEAAVRPQQRLGPVAGGSPMMTALPPPRSMPAQAAL